MNLISVYSLRNLRGLCASAVMMAARKFTAETQRTRRGRRGFQIKTPTLDGNALVYFDAAIASSKISRATSAFSFVRIRGGDQRMELGPQPSRISPR